MRGEWRNGCFRTSLARVSVELDFRVGGRFRVVMHGEKDYVHVGQYLVIEPHSRLCFTWISEFLPEAVAATRVDVTFEAVGRNRTRLRPVHEMLPDHPAYGRHPQGWARILSTLETYLEGAPE